MSEDLYEKLNKLSESDIYPFHMPGHKRMDVRSAIPDDTQSEVIESERQGGEFARKKIEGGDTEKWYPEKFDITEINGFDNLHHTTGILKEINMRLAKLYCIKNARMLVGGSTTGILAGVFATVRPGDIILMARNCHMSVYHALLLAHVKVKFLYPESSGVVLPEKIKKAFEENPDIKEVIITDPTYEGMKSDIKAISEIVHENEALLFVDAAHGAHLIDKLYNAESDRNKEFSLSSKYKEAAFSENQNNKSGLSGRQKGRAKNAVEIIFPCHPIKDGADIAVSSLHKTLPALTGTAEILFSDSLPEEFVQKTDDAIDIFETSSPSYIMMASISNCVEFLEEKGEIAYAEYENRLKKFYKETAKLKYPMILSPGKRDPSKIMIMAGNQVTGYEIMDILRRKYHIELEEASENYCLAMTSIMDTDEGFRRLKIALSELNKRFRKKEVAENTWILPDFEELDGVKTTSENSVDIGLSGQTDGALYQNKFGKLYDFSSYYFARKNKVSDDGSIGKTAAGFVEIYPPGVPFLFPGLKITEDMVKYINDAKENGAEIIGKIDEA